MENNTLATILKRNQFIKVSDIFWKKSDGFRFDVKDDYSLTYDVDKFGFLHQILIVWLKYEECVKQLETAIKMIEIQYETNTHV